MKKLEEESDYDESGVDEPDEDTNKRIDKDLEKDAEYDTKEDQKEVIDEHPSFFCPTPADSLSEVEEESKIIGGASTEGLAEKLRYTFSQSKARKRYKGKFIHKKRACHTISIELILGLLGHLPGKGYSDMKIEEIKQLLGEPINIKVLDKKTNYAHRRIDTAIIQAFEEDKELTSYQKERAHKQYLVFHKQRKRWKEHTPGLLNIAIRLFKKLKVPLYAKHKPAKQAILFTVSPF
eukprot:TRINITY_DN1412_c0_g2_i1.p1 TRINITY_DN1412_c0_g2~~TRINITY_DN1412_c0_g2_i1.p1  ORF type:complete len:236 (+),score=42.22 TRINITY_DN1412_c0_g2_i1:880-1587(+)